MARMCIRGTTVSRLIQCKSLADLVVHVHASRTVYVDGISFLCIGRKSNLSSTFDCLSLFLHNILDTN